VKAVKIATSWLALLGFVASGVLGAPGGWLCLGADGHVGVNDLHRPSCHEESTDPKANGSSPSVPNILGAAGASCEACVDIPLNPDRHAAPCKRPRSIPSAKTFAGSAGPATAVRTPPTDAGLVPPARSPGIPTESDHLRTVVLLI